MVVCNRDRAKILVEALPYIKKYNGKIVVVKYGGNAMTDENIKNSVMEDLVLMTLIGIKIVLVHGGGPEIDELLQKIGKNPEFIDGVRKTDEETVEIVQMVLAGKVNKNLVNLIQTKGGKAIGLSGIDGHMIIASKKDDNLGFVGEIERVNILPILDILEKGYIPIISTVACDEKGKIYNINADTVSSKIAGELKAESLICMTDIAGVLTDKHNKDTLIHEISIKEAKKLIDDKIIVGGMIPKVNCCIDAINLGVSKVFIIDGTVPNAILIETLTDEGIGTMFIKGE